MPRVKFVLLLAIVMVIGGLFLWQRSNNQSVIKVTPEPTDSFHWPYYLYVPPSTGKQAGAVHLLVRPLNSGQVDDDTRVHDAYAARLVEREKKLADALGAPLLVPTYPRLRSHPHTYTHALDRDTLLSTIQKLERLDLQLIAMIEDARRRLAIQDVQVDRRVLLNGFSACGSFSIRFTALHPERVKAAAVGSPGGWPIAPVAEYNGKPLSYPVGIADLAELVERPFDLETFKTIPIFFYLGDQDVNDSVPYQDSFSTDQRDLIFAEFGPDPLSRWPIAERLYAEVGSAARFEVYPSLGHTTSEATKRDVLLFFKSALEELP